MRLAAFISVFLLAAFCAGCGDDQTEDDIADMEVDVTPRTCFPPDGLSGRPASVDEVVAHINALPRPVALPCFLESLERPLAVWATWNTFSAQPAVSPLDPRIFIFEDGLIMSVVTAGEGRSLLEMSERTSPETSIKAEILFPVEHELALADAYNRIGDADGTECGFCHLGGRQVTGIEGAWPWESEFIAGDENKEVDLPYLTDTWQRCDRDNEPDRCWMLDSIMGHGDVTVGSFE